jgi:hypothetical protein
MRADSPENALTLLIVYAGSQATDSESSFIQKTFHPRLLNHLANIANACSEIPPFLFRRHPVSWLILLCNMFLRIRLVKKSPAFIYTIDRFIAVFTKARRWNLTNYKSKGFWLWYNTAYKITILLVYGCETWYLTLMEKYKWKMFENKKISNIFGCKWVEITEDWKKLQNEKIKIL